MSLLNTIVPIVRSVFSRWTALQLAVSHSMGGSESEAKYEAFIEAFGEYLTRNIRPSSPLMAEQSDIQAYLDEVLDEEFDTVLDDGSSQELAQMFVRYIQLILQGKLNDVQQELQQIAASSTQMSVRNRNEEDSSSSDSDEDMIEEEEEEEVQEVEKPRTQSMDVDEDGWTTIHRRHAGKK